VEQRFRAEKEFIHSLIQRDRAQLDALRPRDRESLDRFKKVMEPAWRHTLQIHFPEGNLLVEAGQGSKVGNYTVSHLAIGRAGKGDRLSVLFREGEKTLVHRRGGELPRSAIAAMMLPMATNIPLIPFRINPAASGFCCAANMNPCSMAISSVLQCVTGWDTRPRCAPTNSATLGDCCKTAVRQGN